MQTRATLTQLVAGAALTKICVGILAAGVGAVSAARADALAPEAAPRLALFVALVATHGAVGVLLLRGSRRDGRAALLGVVLLLVATAFVDSAVGVARPRSPAVLGAALAVTGVQVDAFIPYFLWRFVGEFPSAPDDARARRLLALVVRATLVVGVLLLAANLLPAGPGVSLWSRRSAAGPYWSVQFALVAAAFAVLVARTRHAPRDEARRVALLTAALVAGTAPAVVRLLLLVLWPAAGALLPLRYAGWVIYPCLLATPFAIAYAVLVRRALDVGVIVRAAARYAATRHAVQLALALPLALLAAALWERRHESLAALLGSARVVALAGLTALGAGLAYGRRGLLERVDRHFFRDHYDARRILGELVDRCRRAATPGELQQVLRAEIERALHPQSARLHLLGDAAAGAPLGSGSALAELLAGAREPLDVDVEDERAPVARLPDAERHWLADGGVRLLLPLRDAGGGLVGVLALGEKRSELPYTQEDKRLLAGVVAEAEMTVAYRHMRPEADAAADTAADAEADPARAAEPDAVECTGCGAVAPDGIAHCARCGGATTRAALPPVAGGKFRVEERIGAGGMGVVYRATDLHLGRPVAIKTLPDVSPGEAARLRREARAMALVSHPNLAQIYGIETSRGRPMLIVEYLAGGTLAARLARGPLPVGAALDLGVALAGALSAMHERGILHRDVKPSNIAFTATGEPKLLDFGLARLLGDARVGAREGTPARADPRGRSWTDGGSVVGTLAYMSPETLRGEPPDVSVDLWSLCVVLYEAIGGRNPVARAPTVWAGGRLRGWSIPDIRQLAPAAPAPLAAFIARALGADVLERPRTAALLARALAELRAQADVARTPNGGGDEPAAAPTRGQHALA